MIFGPVVSLFPTPFALQQDIPLSSSQIDFIQKSRQTIIEILHKKDPRLLLLVGPCSIHDVPTALEYGARLQHLAQEVSDKIFIVMRTYVEKPRTALGWKGLFHDPYLDGSYAIEQGARKTRYLLSALTQLGLPLGAELLELYSAPFYSDFLSWGCIGARTSASPPHRQLASGLPFPVGFKNSVDGNVDSAIHGLVTAAAPHAFLSLNLHNQLAVTHTQGNPHCHIILRGSHQKPNYFPEDLVRALHKARRSGVCDSVMIDCSHGNSARQHERQIMVFEEALQQRLTGTQQIVGLMLESFLEEGAQQISSALKPGVSVTDACLSWETTERLILNAYQALSASTEVLATT